MKEITREAIDFMDIHQRTGVRKGQIFRSPHFGWVVSGHPEIDLISIDPPHNIGDIVNGQRISNVRIENNHWVYESTTA